jgi:steroid delta-isomerase-like uncharacterized protein
MSQIENGKRVVCAFVRAINAQDWMAVERLVASSFVRHSYAAPAVRSREDLVRYLRSEYETFPDARETIEDMIAEGGKIAVRHRFTGTQTGPMGSYPPSGRSMTAEYIAVYRIEGDAIVEAWVEWDNLNGLAQLGHYPAVAQPGAPADRPTTASPLSSGR